MKLPQLFGRTAGPKNDPSAALETARAALASRVAESEVAEKAEEIALEEARAKVTEAEARFNETGLSEDAGAAVEAEAVAAKLAAWHRARRSKLAESVDSAQASVTRLEAESAATDYLAAYAERHARLAALPSLARKLMASMTVDLPVPLPEVSPEIAALAATMLDRLPDGARVIAELCNFSSVATSSTATGPELTELRTLSAKFNRIGAFLGAIAEQNEHATYVAKLKAGTAPHQLTAAE